MFIFTPFAVFFGGVLVSLGAEKNGAKLQVRRERVGHQEHEELSAAAPEGRPPTAVRIRMKSRGRVRMGICAVILLGAVGCSNGSSGNASSGPSGASGASAPATGANGGPNGGPSNHGSPAKGVVKLSLKVK